MTGGAGFLGSHLADELLENGYQVRALDNLDPPVHGADAQRPDYLDPEIEMMVGDLRDNNAVPRALDGVDAGSDAIVAASFGAFDAARAQRRQLCASACS